MNAWTAAALTVWGIGVGLSLAFFAGKGRLELKQYVADRARDEYVNRQIASLDKQFEVK